MNITDINESQYLSFYKSIYCNDTYFKDNKSEIFQLVRDKKQSFRQNSTQKLIAVTEGGTVYTACLLIIHRNAPHTLFLGFFEAVSGAKAQVATLLGYATEYAQKHNCKKLVVGIDGHINNCVGFPRKEGEMSFSENLGKEYYHEYFSELKQVKFTSYTGKCTTAYNALEKDTARIAKITKDFTIEQASFITDYRKTIERYNALNNIVFADHPYYYKRELAEDFDMFRDFRLLLRNSNLLFATHRGKDVGFMFYYPDFNEIVDRGEGVSIKTFFKFLTKKPQAYKIMEIGVLPEYRTKGIIVMLLHSAVSLSRKTAKKIISSWIIEGNTASTLITKRYTQTQYKDFYVYEKEL